MKALGGDFYRLAKTSSHIKRRYLRVHYSLLFSMPEGPETYIYAKQMNDEFQGSWMVGTEWIPGAGNHSKLANYELFVERLPARVECVKTNGKKVIWCLRDPRNNPLYFVISLALTGNFMLQPDQYVYMTWHFGTFEKSGNHIISWTERSAYFADKRPLANLYCFVTQASYDTFMKSVGTDLMDFVIRQDRDELNKGEEEKLKKEWITQARRSTRTDWEICKFMMNQKIFAGIGNYLKAEILFAARISPHRLIKTLTNEELLELLSYTLQIMLESYLLGAATLSDFRDLYGEKGQFKCKVYGKFTRGEKVIVDKKRYDPIVEPTTDTRKTHWCPELQF